MNNRLADLRSALKLNQTDFGRMVGLSTASVSALESGLRNITDRHIMLLCSTFNVNENWLRHGTGKMFVEDDTTIITDLAKEYHLDDIDKKIIEHYVKLSTEDRKAIKNYIISLAAQISENEETAVTTIEDEIEAEVAQYRREIEAEKKGKMLSASTKQRKDLSG